MSQKPQISYDIETGDKYWRLPNGDYHREDGPAIELSTGSNHWYFYNQLHRTDGPAIITRWGHKEWWINGKEYTYEKWKDKCRSFAMKCINTSKNEIKPIVLIL